MANVYRSLSGIKPTGEPHLGNYFGMIAPAVELAKTHLALYFVADYHALTTERDPEKVHYNTLAIAATFMAMGLHTGEGSGSLLFRQSAVPEVHELAWYLATTTNMGTLQRGHAVKASEQAKSQLSVGTFMYPVLMAADILLYGTDVVPVGKDQHQHLQMAQEMATHVNYQYGRGDKPLLKIPTALVSEAPVVLGSDGEKMSKSRGNTLSPFADPDTVKAFVKSMKTDSTPLNDPKNPDTCPVAQLFKLVDPEGYPNMVRRYLNGGYGYGHAKKDLTDALVARFEGPRKEYLHLMSDPVELEGVLTLGGEGARTLAMDVLSRVRKSVGTAQ